MLLFFSFSQITEFHFCIFTVEPTLLHKICVHVYLLWSRGIVGRSASELTVWMDWISKRGRKKSSQPQKVHTGSEAHAVSILMGTGFISQG
jgi:hypothetical protein